MLKLTYTIEGQTRSIELNDGSVIIGRSSDCDIAIKNASVSKQHVRLDVQGDQATFRDLMSSNGTRLNGNKMAEGPLRQGDVLTLGKLEIRATDPFSVMEPDATDGETQDVPIGALFAPAAGDAPADQGETPPDGNFVPLAPPAEGASHAMVQVVRPGEGGGNALAPTAPPPPPDETRKKKIIIAASAVLFVLALAILMMPSPDTPDKPQGTSIDYWGTIREGEAAFMAGRYSEARQTWEALHEQWREARPESSLEVAEQYADVARAFETGFDGRFEAVRWMPLRSQLRETVDMMDVIPTDRAEFAHNMLSQIATQMDAQEIYQQAETLRESGSYEQAIAAYVRIPAGTVYQSVVAERRQQCLDAQFEQLKTAAMQYAAERQWGRAIEQGEAALGQRDDAELAADLSVWRENSRIETLVKRFKNQLEGDRLDEAATSLQELKRVDEGHYAVAGLLTLQDQLQKKIYLNRLQMLYATWNETALEEALQDPAAQQADAQRIFIKVKNLKRMRDKAEEELNSKGAEGPFRARDIWQAMVELEPNQYHPMNLLARNKLRDHKLPDIGAKLKKEAMESFRNEEYKRARELLQIAQTRCKVDVSTDVETIMEKGRKLYNEGNSLWFAPGARRYAAEIKWKQARDCFLPGEKWYKTVDDQIRKKLGGG